MKNVPSRRALLRAAFSLSLVLGSAALAHADTNPFLATTTWTGNTFRALGNASLDVTSSQGSLSLGSLKINGVPTAVSITWNAGAVQILALNNSISISGTVAPQNLTYGFSGTYTSKNYPGLADTNLGTFSLSSANAYSLVSETPTTANIPSISIVPPDFKGIFEGKYSGIGEIALSNSGVVNQTSRTSVLTGKTSLNGNVFTYLLTLAGTPNTDGSYNFDLLGNSALEGSVAPFVAMSGRFFPSTGRTSASLGGSFQLLGVKGDLIDLGGVSLVATR